MSRPSIRVRILVRISLMDTRRKLGLHAQTLGTVLDRGAQADARGAIQLIYRGGRAFSRCTCLSPVQDRGAQAVARGAVS